jgi:protoporphyrinogen IX oxidase
MSSLIYQMLVAAHVAANLVWIGSILSVALALVSRAGEGRVAAQIAYELYRKLAMPSFVVSFVTALTRLLASPDLYFVETKYMPGKLLFALIVIVLHHFIGARAKAVATGRRSAPGPVGVWALLLAISAVAATLFVILKPF